MDLITNPLIDSQIKNQVFFDLAKNNNRLEIITFLNEDPLVELKYILNKIVHDNKVNGNYYRLNNLFKQAHLEKNNENSAVDIIVNLIIETICQKIKIIRDSLDNEDDDICLASYIQLWKSYKDFSQELYKLLKNNQKFLIERSIKNNKISHDILSILEICMFYDLIIESNDTLLTFVSKDLSEINLHNIDQLIDYVDSIRAFIMMKEFTTISRDKLFEIIKNIMNKTDIINIMCIYMNNLLKNLTNKQLVIDEMEYETTDSNDAERKIIKKIYKIGTILSTYADKQKLLLCYTKFMQARIIDPNYDNLELEIEIIKRMSGTFGREESQKLIDKITDIVYSKNINQLIHKADVSIKNEEYQKLTNITPSIINAITITKNNWKIFNTSELEPIYPLEIKCYLDIIEKCYAFVQNNYFIQWQPTLGFAQFEVYLGMKKIEITCNILQAIVLCHLNSFPETTIENFSKITLIPLILTEKIFQSLFESNILTYHQLDQSIYIINHQNYTGDFKIDIRKTFIEMFEVENQEIPNEDHEIPNDSENENEEDDEHQKFIKEEIKQLSKIITELSDAKYLELAEEAWKIKDQTTKTQEYRIFISKVLRKVSSLIPNRSNKDYMYLASHFWKCRKMKQTNEWIIDGESDDSEIDSEIEPKKSAIYLKTAVKKTPVKKAVKKAVAKTTKKPAIKSSNNFEEIEITSDEEIELILKHQPPSPAIKKPLPKKIEDEEADY